jgi:hypothetical protein
VPCGPPGQRTSDFLQADRLTAPVFLYGRLQVGEVVFCHLSFFFGKMYIVYGTSFPQGGLGA